jgi:hypothetical protein
MFCRLSSGHLTGRKVIWGSVLLFLVALPGTGFLHAQRTVLAPTVLERFRLEPITDTPGAFSGLRSSVKGATIYGIVQNQLGLLVPNAGVVVVRDLRDGGVVAESRVDELAQFAVRGFAPGLYTAELVDVSGGIIATTASFSAEVGEVIQLAPVVPVTPAGWLSTVVGNATSSAVSSAAGAGVMALDSGEPISP